MAKKALRLKAAQAPKFKVRTYNRCPICGRELGETLTHEFTHLPQLTRLREQFNTTGGS